MLDVVLAVPFWLEFVAVLAGGLAGAMTAARARFDIFGVISIAIVTGLAGGIIRDILLQDYGIYAFQKPELILACVVAGIAVYFFSKLVRYLTPVINLLDNLSIALWTIIGAGKALSAGLDIVPAIVLGTITAVGGGITRDIAMSRAPEAFQAGTMNGSAALIGAIVYVFMAYYHVLDDYSAIICVALIIALRYLSLFFGWRTRPSREHSGRAARRKSKPEQSAAHRISPPKGKVERDKERRSYERLRKFWARLNAEDFQSMQEQEAEEAQAAQNGKTEDRRQTAKQTEAQQEETKQEVPAASQETQETSFDPYNDPSDRIVVNREELYDIIHAGSDDTDGAQKESKHDK